MEMTETIPIKHVHWVHCNYNEKC